MDVLTTIGLAILSVVLVLIIYTLVKAMTRVVPEEQRVVVYRLGRFHRVAGPGPVYIVPKFERIAQVIEVRDHPREVTVPGIFAFGVPNELTLSLWCSFDPVRASGGDRSQQGRFVQVRNVERNRQVEVKMREALVEQIAELQKRMPLLPEETTGVITLDSVLALAPGGDRYNTLLDAVKYQLDRTLRSIGMILNTSQPIVLTFRGLPKEIIEAMQQTRSIDISGEALMKYAANLRQDFPGIPDATVAQILGAIPEVDLGNLQPHVLEQGGDWKKTEYEMPQDGSGTVNVLTTREPPPKEANRRQGSESRVYTQTNAPASEEDLSDNDLAVLKRVPRGDSGRRLTA